MSFVQERVAAFIFHAFVLLELLLVSLSSLLLLLLLQLVKLSLLGFNTDIVHMWIHGGCCTCVPNT